MEYKRLLGLCVILSLFIISKRCEIAMGKMALFWAVLMQMIYFNDLKQ